MTSPNFCVSFVPKTISDYCSCRCLIPLLLASALLLGGCKDTKTPSSSEDDTTAPTLAEITAVHTYTNDTTPSYTFSSSEYGTIGYWGSCTGSTNTAYPGNNIITFNTLSEGTYSNCTLTVTDPAGNRVWQQELHHHH